MRWIAVVALLLASCGGGEAPTEHDELGMKIQANNAFFYYANLEAAERFYEEKLGLAPVADYGFARIYRVASTSYLTLVDAAEGMHSADEPKTVAIALVTDELEEWYEYLSDQQVSFRSELKVVEGGPHDGFVVVDPEGYFLEFERFNPHPENERFIPVLAEAETVATSRPELGFKATVLWMYYKDMEAIQRFYEEVMGLEKIVDQGWAHIYPTSATGFIGLVDESRGMHSYTEDKAVTVSFLTDELDAWYEHLRNVESFELRTPEILDEGFVRVLVGYDPENYFLEFDTFLEDERNTELLRLLEHR